MKFHKYLFITLLSVITLSACKQADKKSQTQETNLPVKLATTSLNIEGMTCAIGCAKTIESKISKIDGVTASEVDFDTKKGTFTYDENKTSEAEIKAAIDGLLDGKTYTAAIDKKCDASCTKPCCAKKEVKSCTQECADKCGHKLGEACEECAAKIEACKLDKKKCCKAKQ